MATRKTTDQPFDLWEWLQESAEEWEANNVKREYAISEITPREHQPGTHGGSWTPGQSRIVSPTFGTEDEARAWANEYTPDEGNHFAITTIDHQKTITRHVFVGNRLDTAT